MSEWYRNAGGEVIHRASCTRKGRCAHPWHYGDRQGETALIALVESTPWLRFCSYCTPVGGAA